jgi:hypothetical protein
MTTPPPRTNNTHEDYDVTIGHVMHSLTIITCVCDYLLCAIDVQFAVTVLKTSESLDMTLCAIDKVHK